MTGQEARDDELEALIAEARREAGRWGPAPTATGMLINRLADALARKHSEPEQGSCWDEAPSVRVPPGECAPMPMLCELQAGHLGAHRSGVAEWMRGRQHAEPEITDEPLHGWEYGHQVSLHTGTTIHPVADEKTARTLAWLHPVYRRHAPGPWVPVGEGEQ